MRKTNQNVDEKVTIEENKVDTTPDKAPETEDHVEAEAPADKPVQKESLLKKGSDVLMSIENWRVQKEEAKEKKRAEKAAAKAAKKAENAGKGKGLKTAVGIGLTLAVVGATGKAIADFMSHSNETEPDQEVPGEPMMLEDSNVVIEEPSVEEPVPIDLGNEEETM